MVEYIIRVVRLTASKFRFDVSVGESLLYVFSSEDPLDALERILKLCYFGNVSLRKKSLDDFLLAEISSRMSYVALFSRVERERVMSFYI